MHKLQHAGGIFALLLIFFAFLASGFALSSEIELRSKNDIKSSTLAAAPGTERDDHAALRWNYRCRAIFVVRGEKRNNLHTVTPSERMTIQINSSFPDIKSDKTFLLSNQPEFTYYRRLWQKILPSRAGPCA